MCTIFALHFDIHLHKYLRFMRLLIADIESIIVCGMVDFKILDYIVVINEFARLKMSLGLDLSRIAEFQ